MTYCVAWKSSHSIFMVADTGVTGKASMMDAAPISVSEQQKYSSFGESHSVIEGQYTDELLYKVHQVNDQLLFGYAGAVALGHELLQLIKSSLQRSENVITAIQLAVASLTPLTKPNSLQAVFGFFMENQPILYEFNGDGAEQLREAFIPVHLGSARNVLAPVVGPVLQMFIERTCNDDLQLPYATSILQHCSVHSSLPSVAAAGAFFGGRLTQHGMAWQEDTIYCLYAFHRGSLTPIDFIRVFFRNDTLLIFSTLSNSQKAIQVTNELSLNDSVYEYETELNRLFDQLTNERRAKYYVFLSKAHRTITVVHAGYQCANQYFSIDDHQLHISGELMQKMATCSEPENKAHQRFVFHWLR